ncbi:MAG: ATP-binding protein [Chloroflexota bacterium]
MSTEVLKGFSLFAGLSDKDLDRLCRMSETVNVRAGEVLMAEGTPGTELYIVLAGQFEVSIVAGERPSVIATTGPGEVLGEIALVEESERTATVRAVTDGTVLKVGRQAFEHLIACSPKTGLAIMRNVADRLRNTELMLRHSAKMAALGTLSAGLAHELNNPAAAVRRGAAQLHDALAQLQRMAAQLDALGLDQRQTETIGRLRAEMPARAIVLSDLDPLARGDRESALEGWLEAQQVDNPWEVAPPLVNLGWGVAELEALSAEFSPAQRPTFATWLASACAVYVLLDEVSHGAERISQIVAAVKSYSHLDRAPVQLVDIHEGLEDTLIILHHKLKQGVNVVRDYSRDLPRIEAFAGELNQVWTNIVDNAIDAMAGHGEIAIRTYADGPMVAVEIADNGPGIPPEVQPRLFEAFFTTKGPGVGTGLGLHISYNIVVNQHRGSMAVESRPGRTVFTVRLPVKLAV